MHHFSDQPWLAPVPATVAGDEELAREALRRRQGQQAAADGLCQQLAAQRKAADQLGGNVRMLEGKIQVCACVPASQ
jgi:phage shock protein A